MSRKTVKVVALLFVIALLLPTLAACQTAQVSEPETIVETVVVTEKEYVEVTPTALPAPVKEGGPVFIGTSGMTAKHYNPIWLTCNPQFLTFPLILPALTWFDNNIQPVPDLAESIDVNEDATVYTFHLPENAEWSDGTPLTANDVYFTYKLVLTPGVGAGSWNNNFATIKGVEAYKNGEAEEIEGIVVVDDHTVQMELTAPNAVFLTKTYLGIMPEHILGGLTAEELETAEYVDNPVVTSGPYEFVEYKEDQYIKFVKKDNYWGKQVNLDEVYVKIFESNATMLAQLEAGEIDIAMLPPEEVARFEEIDYINAMEVQGVGYYVTHIDARTEEQVQVIRDAGAWEVPEDYEVKPYLQDARFRQALAYALDTNAFIAVVEEGQATPIFSPIFGPEWAVNPDLNTYERDLDQSRALMEEVGVTFNDKGTALWEDEPIELVFLTTSSEKKRLFGEVLQQQFGEVGIRLDIKMVTSSAFIAAAVAGEGDLIQNAGGRFGADPSVSEAYYSCTAGWGTLVTGYCNEAYDALMTEGVAVSDVDTRAATYFDASAILNEDLPSLFFYTSSSFTGVNAGLTGVQPSADPGYLTWNIEDWAFTE